MSYKYLNHHGVKGQKWGVRRYQNEDGSLTPAGKKKYYTNEDGTISKKPMSTGKKIALTTIAAGGVMAISYDRFQKEANRGKEFLKERDKLREEAYSLKKRGNKKQIADLKSKARIMEQQYHSLNKKTGQWGHGKIFIETYGKFVKIVFTGAATLGKR